MKKLWLMGLVLPSMVMSSGLDEGINMVAKTGTLFGTIVVVVVVSLWLLPIAFATLVYTGQKKKAEQMHEEVGLKAAILSLLAAVLGAAMAFYVVGTIGMYADGNSTTTTLQAGNHYLLSAVVGSGVDKF